MEKMIWLFFIVGLVVVFIFAKALKNFLPKIGITSKLYFWGLVITSFLTYSTLLLKMIPDVQILLFLEKFFSIPGNQESFVLGLLLSFIVFSALIFYYLYIRVIAKAACLSTIHAYLIVLLLLIAYFPSSFVFLFPDSSVIISIVRSYNSILLLVSKVSMFIFTLYQALLHVDFASRFSIDNTTIGKKIGNFLIAFFIGGPVVFVIYTLNGAKTYQPCNSNSTNSNA